MAHQVMWNELSVTDKDGVGHIVHRGADLPDWVDDFTLMALTTTGAVQVVDRPDAKMSEKDEKAMLASLAAVSTPNPDVPDELTKPSPDDPKPAWVDYASDARNPNRITHDQAMGMTKSALMERFK